MNVRCASRNASSTGTTVITLPAITADEVLGVLALERGQPERQGGVLVRVDRDQRPEQVVPHQQEGERRQGRQRRLGQRQRDVEQDAEARAAVDPRRLLDLARQVDEELAHQEDAERERRARARSAPPSVSTSPSLSMTMKVGIIVSWNGMIRVSRMSRKSTRRAAEPQPREGVAGERAEDQVRDHGHAARRSSS